MDSGAVERCAAWCGAALRCVDYHYHCTTLINTTVPPPARPAEAILLATDIRATPPSYRYDLRTQKLLRRRSGLRIEILMRG